MSSVFRSRAGLVEAVIGTVMGASGGEVDRSAAERLAELVMHQVDAYVASVLGGWLDPDNEEVVEVAARAGWEAHMGRMTQLPWDSVRSQYRRSVEVLRGRAVLAALRESAELHRLEEGAGS